MPRADQQHKTAEAERKRVSTLDLFTEHAHEFNLALGRDGDMSQLSYVKEPCPWFKHNCEAVTAAAAASQSHDDMLSPPDLHLPAQSQSCSNFAAKEHKPSTPRNFSAPPVGHSDQTSTPVTHRLQTGDTYTEQEASCRPSPQSSPESVHEPTIMTSKQRPIPLSWDKSRQTPSDPLRTQVSGTCRVL